MLAMCEAVDRNCQGVLLRHFSNDLFSYDRAFPSSKFEAVAAWRIALQRYISKQGLKFGWIASSGIHSRFEAKSMSAQAVPGKA
ncbi:MAG TPA: hypothetical protein VGU46_14385 [Acidobacteriaceae bacterium]|nr:hypothetical protein [Acidobacteriaceae bacterium]